MLDKSSNREGLRIQERSFLLHIQRNGNPLEAPEWRTHMRGRVLGGLCWSGTMWERASEAGGQMGTCLRGIPWCAEGHSRSRALHAPGAVLCPAEMRPISSGRLCSAWRTPFDWVKSCSLWCGNVTLTVSEFQELFQQRTPTGGGTHYTHVDLRKQKAWWRGKPPEENRLCLSNNFLHHCRDTNLQYGPQSRNARMWKAHLTLLIVKEWFSVKTLLPSPPLLMYVHAAPPHS